MAKKKRDIKAEAKLALRTLWKNNSIGLPKGWEEYQSEIAQGSWTAYRTLCARIVEAGEPLQGIWDEPNGILAGMTRPMFTKVNLDKIRGTCSQTLDSTADAALSEMWLDDSRFGMPFSTKDLPAGALFAYRNLCQAYLSEPANTLGNLWKEEDVAPLKVRVNFTRAAILKVSQRWDSDSQPTVPDEDEEDDDDASTDNNSALRSGSVAGSMTRGSSAATGITTTPAPLNSATGAIDPVQEQAEDDIGLGNDDQDLVDVEDPAESQFLDRPLQSPSGLGITGRPNPLCFFGQAPTIDLRPIPHHLVLGIFNVSKCHLLSYHRRVPPAHI